MKDNTKVRLHLSKRLFESITKQVLAEAKKDMSGGVYTETVKTPSGKTTKKDGKVTKANELPTSKKPKPTSAEKKSPEIKKASKERKINEVDPVADTDKMRKLGEVNDREETKKMEKMHEKMSSKEKMAKGLYKEEMEDESMMNEDIFSQIANMDWSITGPALAFAATILGVGGAFVKDAVSRAKEKGYKGVEGLKKAAKEVGAEAGKVNPLSGEKL